MRFRDLGVTSGTFPTGEYNAITDVTGVRVGHTTLMKGTDIRTGVTAIVPHENNIFKRKVIAAVHTINGFGKAHGFEQVRELGTIETPILLTNTLNVGRVSDALGGVMIARNPELSSVNVLVGECNDSYLNDIQARVVDDTHVLNAIRNATTGRVDEGCVGAGTGTQCYGFKGGIGTASRVVDLRDEPFTVGVLMQTNFGARPELTMLGVPIGYHIEYGHQPPPPEGSVMIVIATNAPLTARQLGRLTHRAAFGLARTGTVCHNGSGDFVVAFSTANPIGKNPREVTHLPDTGEFMNPLFAAVVEAVEESVYNALLQAVTVTGYRGNTLHALPADQVRAWLKHYRRL